MGHLSDSSESLGLLVGQTFPPSPRSMGGELDPDDDGHFGDRRPVGWRDSLRSFDWRKQWKLVVLGVILTFVTVGFLLSSVLRVKTEKTLTGIPASRPGEKAAATAGDDDNNDDTNLVYPPYDDIPFADASSRQCGVKLAHHSRAVFELVYASARNLSVVQHVLDDEAPPAGPGRPPGARDIRILGDILVRRAGPGTPAPSIVLETASSHAGVQPTADWDAAAQRLALRTPRRSSAGGPAPCLALRATVWAPPDSQLASITVETVHLGIRLLDNLSLRLAAFARLASTVGPIVSATDGTDGSTARLLRGRPPPPSFALDARYVAVKTVSAAIAGHWPLFDYLGLETISGAIHAAVGPQPALAATPLLPAILYVRSTSGTIDIVEPIDITTTTTSSSPVPLLPARQYGLDLYSMSGTITARAAFGASCKVHTTSGRVNLTLLPVLDARATDATDAPTSFLDTTTTSGATAITVLEPLWADLAAGTYADSSSSSSSNTDLLVPPSPAAAAAAAADTVAPTRRPLRALSGRHTATSATLRVRYPSSWEGWIDEDSMTGRLAVAGQGVQIVRQGDEFPGIKKHILAHKGADGAQGGTLKLHTTSGGIAAVIGS